jgi:anti-anti-sigma factor
MDIAIKIANGKCVAGFEGDLNFDSHPEFRKLIDVIQGKTINEVTLDLSGLKSIDAAGIAMLLIGWKTANRSHVTITLCKPNKSVKKKLLEAKFDILFNIV